MMPSLNPFAARVVDGLQVPADPHTSAGPSDRLCRRLALGLILASVAFHLAYLAFACPLDLSPDEAHYWQWSRHLAWSYYSKGPLVAWLIRASCELFGPLSESLVGSPMLAVRLPAVACHAALLAGWYVLTVSTLKSHRAALAVVALALTFPAVVAGAVLMTIDPPFLACWCWAAVGVWKGLEASQTAKLARAFRVIPTPQPPPCREGVNAGEASLTSETAQDATPPFTPSLQGGGWGVGSPRADQETDGTTSSSLRWWVFAGVCAALGVLAKYPMVLLPACMFFYLWFRQRDELKRPGFWLFAAGSVVGLAPILAWNAANDWVSFRHVGTQAAGHGGSGVRWLGPLAFAGGQAALLLGVWFVVWGSAAFAYRRTPDPALSFLWWAAVPVWGVFAGASLMASGQINWPAAAYSTGLVLMVNWVRERLNGPHRKAVARLVGVGVAVGLALSTLAHFPGLMRPALAAAAGPPSDKQPTPIRRFDPTARLRGWSTLAGEVDRIRDRVRAETGAEPLVAGTVWNVPGALGVYCKGHPETYSFGTAMTDRHSQYDIWRPNPVADAQAFFGRTFVFVGDGLPSDAGIFERIEPPTVVVHREEGVPVSVWWVWVGHGFRGFPEKPAGPRRY
jgi:4-amino-4-deoxy-L-arabinose transferase-like glycosyltransferase